MKKSNFGSLGLTKLGVLSLVIFLMVAWADAAFAQRPHLMVKKDNDTGPFTITHNLPPISLCIAENGVLTLSVENTNSYTALDMSINVVANTGNQTVNVGSTFIGAVGSGMMINPSFSLPGTLAFSSGVLKVEVTYYQSGTSKSPVTEIYMIPYTDACAN